LKAQIKAHGGGQATGELWSFTQVLRDLPVAVYATDETGTIVFFNEAARKLWGQEPMPGATFYCGAHILLTSEGQPLAPEQSPVALLLKGEQPIQWRHLVAERPDGSRVPFAAFPSLLKRPDGSIYGAVNTLLDLTEHERADAASVRLAAIVESSSDAIVSKDLGGILTSWNRAAELLFGYTAEEAIGWPITMLIPADRQEEEYAIIGKIRRGESVKAYETIRQRKDGSLVPVSLTVSPVRDGEGRIVGASKIVRDISVRVENQQRMRHLMRELNHRVKNQYAVILSMIRETRKRSRTPEQFERQVRERIMALSASHDLLVSEDWKWTTLFELLLTQLKPFGHEARFTISGPPIRIRPNAVQHLGIAFHELGANALVHGALAAPTGTIRISWERLQEPGRPERIALVWEEKGSRPAIETLQKGFGIVVLERIVPESLGGSATLAFGADGFTWRLEAPASAMLPDSEGPATWREY
jgi:PAS domain S-box-containing protein